MASHIKLSHKKRRTQIQKAIGTHDMLQLKSTWYESVQLQGFLLFTLTWYALLCWNVSVSWRSIICTYLVFPAVSNSITSIVHELSHGHLFSADWIFIPALLVSSIFLPVVPFKILHDHHHKDFQHTELDFETAFKRNPVIRRLSICNQVAAICALSLLKPSTVILTFKILMVRPLKWRVASVMSIGIYMTWVYMYPVALLFLLISFTLHPLNSRIWREHPLHQDTMSSYSPLLGLITLGMCRHVEHHDFPWVDCHKLHLLKKLAPQQYTQLHHTNSVAEDFRLVGVELRGR
jgi:fatty acid desaturase